MPITGRNIGADSPIRTHEFQWDLFDNTATALIVDRAIYIPVPWDCRVIEIGTAVSVNNGAANSGSVTVNFYRAASGTVASATTTGLLASGGFAVAGSSSITVGDIYTATLNTSVITGPNAGMLVSADTTLLVNVDHTATSTANGFVGYIKVAIDD